MTESCWSQPFIDEMRVQHIMTNQATHGCQFDKKKAGWLILELATQIAEIDKELVPLLPKMMNKANEFKKPFKINGQFTVHVQNYADKVGLLREEVGGPFTRVWFTPFDPSKTAKVKDVLFLYGWKPADWNVKKVSLLTQQQRLSARHKTYEQVLGELDTDTQEELVKLLDGYMEKQFKGRSIEYIKALLRRIGFTSKPENKKAVRRKLIMSNFWPTSPKINPDEDTWIGQRSMVSELLNMRLKMSHRKSFLEGLKRVTRADGKIPGEANPCATPTARMAHRKLANVPSSGAFYGDKCRALFTSDIHKVKKHEPFIIHNSIGHDQRLRKDSNIIEERGKDSWKAVGLHKILVPANQDVMVGGDGAGLELRMLTHYLVSVSQKLLESASSANEKAIYKKALASALEYRSVLLDGDIHTHNQVLADLPTRAAAKGFIYSFLYGAGNDLLGKQVGGGKNQGLIIRETFLKECPCLPLLIDYIQREAVQGYITAIDGRKLIMRRDEDGQIQTHKALSTLLQAAGSIVMKKANLILHDKLRENRLDASQIIFYHDEFQFSCSADHLEKLRYHIDNCVRLAGEYFNMQVPLASDSMAGTSWLHTH